MSRLQTFENSDEEQTRFFDSTAILLSNLLREHISESIQNLVEFFKRFDMKKPPAPLEILTSEKADFINSAHLDVFLKIHLCDNLSERKIGFEKELPAIRSDVIEILDELVRLSHRVPRPEHSLVRSDKLDLLKISMGDLPGEPTDELYITSKRFIDTVLARNLEATQDALPIYNQFNYLLTPTDLIVTITVTQ